MSVTNIFLRPINRGTKSKLEIHSWKQICRNRFEFLINQLKIKGKVFERSIPLKSSYKVKLQRKKSLKLPWVQNKNSISETDTCIICANFSFITMILLNLVIISHLQQISLLFLYQTLPNVSEYVKYMALLNTNIISTKVRLAFCPLLISFNSYQHCP